MSKDEEEGRRRRKSNEEEGRTISFPPKIYKRRALGKSYKTSHVKGIYKKKGPGESCKKSLSSLPKKL
jgi:hypothetical protein